MSDLAPDEQAQVPDQAPVGDESVGAAPSGDTTPQEPAPAPPTDEEKVTDLVTRLHLEPTEHVLATIWEWASHHFGLSRPAPASTDA